MSPTRRYFHRNFAVSLKARQSRHDGSGGVSRSSLAHDLDRLHEISVEFGINRRVLGGEAREGLLRLGDIVGEDDVIIARQHAEHVGRRQHLVTVFGEFEIGDDPRVQEAHQIAEDGKLEAGHDLLGHRRAAEHGATLQHQRLQAGAREIGAAGQSVMAASDDDRVIALRHVSVLRHLDCLFIGTNSTRRGFAKSTSATLAVDE